MTKILYNGSELHAALSNGTLDINDLQPSDRDELDDRVRELEDELENYCEGN